MNKLFFASITIFLFSGLSVGAGERPDSRVRATKRKVEPISAQQEKYVLILLRSYSDPAYFLPRVFGGKHPAIEHALSEKFRATSNYLRGQILENHQSKEMAQQVLVTTHGFPGPIACIVGECLIERNEYSESYIMEVRNDSIQRFDRLGRADKRLARLHKQLN